MATKLSFRPEREIGWFQDGEHADGSIQSPPVGTEGVLNRPIYQVYKNSEIMLKAFGSFNYVYTTDGTDANLLLEAGALYLHTSTASLTFRLPTDKADINSNAQVKPRVPLVAGDQVRIQHVLENANINIVTVQGNGKTINGSTSIVLDIKYFDVKFIYNGTSWDMINVGQASGSGFGKVRVVPGQTAAITANAGEMIMVSNVALVANPKITLPVGNINDVVFVGDYSNNAQTNPILISPATGQNIEGSTSDDTLNFIGGIRGYQYINAAKGWMIVDDATNIGLVKQYAQTVNALNWCGAATGTANARILNLKATGRTQQTLTAYSAGQSFAFTVPATNTGAVTLNVNNLGVKSLVKNGNQALAAGDLVANQVYEAKYDGVNFQLLGVTGDYATKSDVAAVVGGAPTTLDTLKKLADAINSDPAFATTLNTALGLKAPLASPAFTGTPTVPTAAQTVNNTQAASTAFVKAAIAALVDSSPGALDTLKELAAALGNDPNFATTIASSLALKAPLASPVFTGNPTAPTPAAGDNDTSLATTEFVQREAMSIVKSFGLGMNALGNYIADIDDATLPTGWYAVSSNTTGTKPQTFGIVVVNSRNSVNGTTGRINQVFYSTDTLVWAAWGRAWKSGQGGWSYWSQIATLDSPSFTGNPTVPTQSNDTNNTRAASTGFVYSVLAKFGYGTNNSPSVAADVPLTGASGNYYYAPAVSPYPDFAFVMRMAFAATRGFEIANIPYTDRFFGRASNSDGTWRTPIELARVVSPTFTGDVTMPTRPTADRSANGATTQYVANLLASLGWGTSDLSDLPNGVDLNTLNTGGSYQVNAVVNGPSGYLGGVLFVVGTNAQYYSHQLLFPQGVNKMFHRCSTGATNSVANWTPWVEVGDMNQVGSLITADRRYYSGNVVGIGADTTLVGSQTGYCFNVTKVDAVITLPSATAAGAGGTFTFRNVTSGKITITTPADAGIFEKNSKINTITLQPGEWVELQASTTNYFVNQRGSLNEIGSTISTAMAAFGIGGYSVVSGGDANTITIGGMYHLINPTNSPVGTDGQTSANGYLLSMQYQDGSTYGTQIFIPTQPGSANDAMFFRRRLATTWTAWMKLANNDSPAFTGTPTAPTAADGANNAQVASTSFVQKAMAVYGIGLEASPALTLNSQIDWAKPQGWSGFINLNATKAKGVTVPTLANGSNPSYGMWTITGRRDNSAGYTGIFTDYSNGRTWIGHAAVGANGPTFVESATTDSPAFSGTPTAPTAADNSNSTSIATTAFVQRAMALYGVGTANARAVTDANDVTEGGNYYVNSTAANIPTAANGTLVHFPWNGTSAALQMYCLLSADSRIWFRSKSSGAWKTWRESAYLDSPSFTGTPTAPTATAGSNTTQIASTAFVKKAVDDAMSGVVEARAWGGPVVNVTANKTFVAGDTGKAYRVTTTGLTLTLPVSTTVNDGRSLTIRNESPGNATITVTSGSIFHAYGATSTSLVLSKDETIEVMSSGTNWIVNNRTKLAESATIISPTFTGTPAAPTPASGDNTTRISTTAFVQSAMLDYGLGSRGLVGNNITDIATLANTGFYVYAANTAGAPSTSSGTLIHISRDGRHTQIASDYVGKKTWIRYGQSGGYSEWQEIATIDSPSFTGIPTAPTPNASDTSTKLATTAFVQNAVKSLGWGAGTVTPLTDIDDPTLPNGMYGIGTGTATGTKPTGMTWGVVLVTGRSNFSGTNGRVVQTFYGTDTNNGRTWTRSYYGTNAWSAWRESAYLDSPAFTGTPTVPTQAASDTSTKIASTAHVQAAMGQYGLGVVSMGYMATVDDVTLANGLYGVGSTSVGTKPPGQSFGILQVIGRNNSATNSRVAQTFYSTDGAVSRQWTRNNFNNAWTAWKEVALTEAPNFTKEVTITGTNTIRHVNEGSSTSPALLERIDSSNFYMLLTNVDDPLGNFNALRPFRIGLTTGIVEMANGSTTAAPAASDDSNRVVNSSWVNARLKESTPPGMVAMFARSTPPTGWLKRNGAAVSRTTYADLFAVIGTTFGSGDGTSTFNLPDDRELFDRAWTDGANSRDSDRELFSLQEDMYKTHIHTGTANSAGSHSHTTTFPRDLVNGFYESGSKDAVLGDEIQEGTQNVNTNVAGAHTHSLNINANGGSETRPANRAYLACIKF